MRELFKKRGDHKTMIRVDDVARQVLRLVEQDLLLNKVSLATEFQNDLPEIYADRTQIQQVILNLVRNAIDAMNSTPPRARRLRVATSLNGHSSVLLSVQDTGPGITTRTIRACIRAVLYDEAHRHGIGARHLSDYRPGPRRQSEASQDRLRRMHF